MEEEADVRWGESRPRDERGRVEKIERKEKGKREERGERREGNVEMNLKSIFLEFIAYRIFVKKFKNSISCCVNNLNTILLIKRSRFYYLKEFGLDNLVT